MKTKRKLLLSVLMIAFAVFMALSVSACKLIGSFALTDLIVDTSKVTTIYNVGDEVDLDGLILKAKYIDGSEHDVALENVKFFLGEEDITNDLSKITATAGAVTIKIVYESDFGSKSEEIKFTVTDTIELLGLATFNEPEFIEDFNSSIDSSTDDNTAQNFESNYFTTDDAVYVVGADNAFEFLPVSMDVDGNDLPNVTVNTTVKIKVDTDYVTLTKTLVENSEYEYEYKHDGVLMLVEYAAENKFDFTANAIGSVFAISVLPDEDVYEIEGVDAINFEFKVVDGYNVYSAEQLCVIDNSGSAEWAKKKASLGYADVVTNGIILHNSVQVTKEHIPEEFMYTLPESYNIVYKLGEEPGSPEKFGLGRTFLWNQYDGNPELFVRKLTSGQKFNIYGNFYDIDLSKLPLVASFESNKTPSGDVVGDAYYGSDFSNTSFLRILGDVNTKGTDDETVLFENVAVRGNAKSDALLVTSGTTGYQGNESPVYCGGVIFVKMVDLSAQIENVRAYHFFITFFGEIESDYAGTSACKMSLNKTKVYESASSAMFLWGKVDVEITNSYWRRAGGPLILAQHVDIDNEYPVSTMPTINISEECVMESYVTGSEPWFQSVNATSEMARFVQIDGLLKTMGASMYNNIKGENKMNLITLLMGSGGVEVMTAVDVQGSVTYGDAKVDRLFPTTEQPTVGGILHGVLSSPFAEAPLFNFGADVNNVYYYAGETFGVLSPLNTFVMTNYETYNNGYTGMKTAVESALNGSKMIGLNVGGFGLLLGLHYYAG